MPHRSRSAFTLIELLVVIAIIAILAVVVVLTLNPAELLRQSRDANRVSDMATLNSALNLYVTDQSAASTFSLGTATTSYLSVFDPSATSTLGSQCQGLGLSSSPWPYHCAASSTNRNASSQGWIPVNLSNISAGSPLSNLPVDPTNQTSSDLYYTYATNGTQYEVSAFMESTKYAKQGAGGSDPTLTEVGSGATTLPVVGRGLVGYWPLNEGSGSSTIDWSGGGNNGTWSGTPAGTNGYYSVGKVWQWGGYFNGVNDFTSASAVSAMNFSQANPFTVSLWINPSTVAGTQFVFDKQENVANEFGIDIQVAGGQARFEVGQQGVTTTYANSSSLTAGNWYHVVGVSNGTSISIYMNGVLQSGSPAAIGFSSSTQSIATLYIGKQYQGANWYSGVVNDVRVYNRALSASEIQQIYNAEK